MAGTFLGPIRWVTIDYYLYLFLVWCCFLATMLILTEVSKHTGNNKEN
jgi:hypothetical protein